MDREFFESDEWERPWDAIADRLWEETGELPAIPEEFPLHLIRERAINNVIAALADPEPEQEP